MHSSYARENTLRVITSADPQSRVVHSFIMVPAGKFIPSGIKNNAENKLLALQIPFIIELENKLSPNTDIQWKITIPSRLYGSITPLSKFFGEFKKQDNKIIWQSDILKRDVYDRHKLVFRPKPPQHKPRIYKKGRGPKNKRRKYGGGTRQVDDQPFNPHLKYEVSATLFNPDGRHKTYQTIIEMDKKDMIRQEYINHYGIRRYGRGSNGHLPVPLRNEISEIPENHIKLTGNPLTESKYKLLVDDGMHELANFITDIYEESKVLRKTKPLIDLNGSPLPVPSCKLWLSGGWRNPERNEWYSNALNGMHQRGGAVDIIVTEPPGDIKSAIAYWVLWQGLEDNKHKINAFWQLETHGRPMRTDEFKNDIEPKNGIPDAFDKADHLHANIKSAEK